MTTAWTPCPVFCHHRGGPGPGPGDPAAPCNGPVWPRRLKAMDGGFHPPAADMERSMQMIVYLDRSEVPDLEQVPSGGAAVADPPGGAGGGRYDRLWRYYLGRHDILRTRKEGGTGGGELCQVCGGHRPELLSGPAGEVRPQPDRRPGPAGGFEPPAGLLRAAAHRRGGPGHRPDHGE